ncbi:unnamed protein product [Vitrella brassicaformis CCMP3155]|uniref:Uncharacterized protein n=1 Tax=Vitrella brassicaformis (strain CCMP3155) TaxID=1169540 RepID=A0A0G4FPK6_VITBC|nr:unnamed protein product [Vitrella brassicaformis CCMP3155]|eukprot:CEM15768.1 unnamed protein product [Vitrella brassicaformis CCMP3155]
MTPGTPVAGDGALVPSTPSGPIGTGGPPPSAGPSPLFSPPSLFHPSVEGGRRKRCPTCARPDCPAASSGGHCPVVAALIASYNAAKAASQQPSTDHPPTGKHDKRPRKERRASKSAGSKRAKVEGAVKKEECAELKREAVDEPMEAGEDSVKGEERARVAVKLEAGGEMELLATFQRWVDEHFGF